MILKYLFAFHFGSLLKMILGIYASRVMRGRKMWFQESAGK